MLAGFRLAVADALESNVFAHHIMVQGRDVTASFRGSPDHKIDIPFRARPAKHDASERLRRLLLQ